MSKVPKSTFSEALIRLNRLDKLGFLRWIFRPGMEFASRDKWWHEAGTRQTPHEGIDFCCFADREGNVVTLGENILVPVMYDGAVVKIFNDFLGASILVAHDFQDAGKTLYSIYAHTKPVETLQKGKQVKAEEPIAMIGTPENKGINPHLHLSVILAEKATAEDFDWQAISYMDRAVLCNPFDFLLMSKKDRG